LAYGLGDGRRVLASGRRPFFFFRLLRKPWRPSVLGLFPRGPGVNQMHHGHIRRNHRDAASSMRLRVYRRPAIEAMVRDRQTAFPTTLKSRKLENARKPLGQGMRPWATVISGSTTRRSSLPSEPSCEWPREQQRRCHVTQTTHDDVRRLRERLAPAVSVPLIL